MLTGAIIGAVVGIIIVLIQNNKKKKQEKADVLDDSINNASTDKKEN